MSTPTVRHSRHRARRAALPLALAGTLVALVGCSDGTGGAAGDGDPGDSGNDPFAPSPIEPFVGTWDLLGNWNGTPDDQAYLVIGPVEEDGRSRVRLYDFLEGESCYFRSVSNGRAEPDGARREAVFMNNVFPFDDAVLDLSDGALVIEYFDTFDTDGDGDENEVRTYLAPRAGLTETDLVPGC